MHQSKSSNVLMLVNTGRVRNMRKCGQKFYKDKKGTTIVEYSIILALLGIAAWGALALLGNRTEALLVSMATCTTQAPSTTVPQGLISLLTTTNTGTITIPSSCNYSNGSITSLPLGIKCQGAGAPDCGYPGNGGIPGNGQGNQ
jgi:Flp pilus assembly pilin Flp